MRFCDVQIMINNVQKRNCVRIILHTQVPPPPGLIVPLKGRRAELFCPIWAISEIYLPIDGYYDRAKFRTDCFRRSGGVRVNKKPECSR